MAKVTNKPKKRHRIDQDTYEKLARTDMDVEDICDFFEVTPRAFRAWFKRTYGEAYAPPGRPRVEIDRTVFENLCHIQATLTEIADWFDCSEDTVETWCKNTYGCLFSEAFKKYSAGGKISLRRSQFRLAEKNAAVSIWLGKQYLGQTDFVQVSADINNDVQFYIPDNGRDGYLEDSTE